LYKLPSKNRPFHKRLICFCYYPKSCGLCGGKLYASLSEYLFHQHFTLGFFVQKAFRQLFSIYMSVEKSCVKRFHTKNARIKCWWNLPQISWFYIALWSLRTFFCLQIHQFSSRRSFLTNHQLISLIISSKNIPKMSFLVFFLQNLFFLSQKKHRAKVFFGENNHFERNNFEWGNYDLRFKK